MKINKSGFTLIELLVVITIIGILGTGATATFTSQIQKARDATRITDVWVLRGAIEQAYQDDLEYLATDAVPDKYTWWGWGTTYASVDEYFEWRIAEFTQNIPKDPKLGLMCNNWAEAWVNSWTWFAASCVYWYTSGDDSNGIPYWVYEVSTSFESTGNVRSKALGDVDGWNEDNRYEYGMTTDSLVTNISSYTKPTWWAWTASCTASTDVASPTNPVVWIGWPAWVKACS